MAFGLEGFTNKEVIELSIQAVSALGTILVAFLAIYGDLIKRWLVRPKLTVEVGKDAPFIERITVERAGFGVASSGSSVAVQTETTTISLRVRISNTGKTTATNCQGQVQEILSRRPGNNNTFFKMKSLVPTPLPWHNKEFHFSVSPQLPAYLEVARIERVEAHGQERVSPSGPIEHELYATATDSSTGGGNFRLGKGTFIIPVTLFGDSIAPQTYYFEVYWNGNSFELKTSDFYLKRVSEPQKEAQ